jgi:hypothetical protein
VAASRLRAAPPWRLGMAACVTAGLLGTSSPTRAQDIQREPIRIAYEASPGCPDADFFAARVISRSSAVRLAQPGEAARTFAVTLVDGAPATAELNIVDGEHVESARSVQAETCSDAAEAMALIVALAANPSRRTRVVAAPVPSLEIPEVRPHRAARRPRIPPPLRRAAGNPEPKPERPPSSGVAYAGADLTVTSGVTPDALVSASPYFGWQGRADHFVAPEFRVAVVRSLSAVGVGPGEEASFVWTAGRLDGCPFAWRSTVSRVAACARIEVGALRVDTAGVEDPRTPVRGWFAAGPLVRAQRLLVDALFVDVEIAALIRATDDRFVIAPAGAVYDVPVVGVSAGIGLGALFW